MKRIKELEAENKELLEKNKELLEQNKELLEKDKENLTLKARIKQLEDEKDISKVPSSNVETVKKAAVDQ